MRQTRVLLAVLLGLGLIDLAVQPGPPPTVDRTPWFDAEVPSRIRIDNEHGTVELVRQEDGWEVVAPYEDRADAGAVNALVRLLTHRLPEAHPIEAELADGARVQLDDQVLEIGPPERGQSLVRRDGQVYVAPLGPRSPWQEPPDHWRDPSLLPPGELDRLTLGPHGFRRTEAGWQREDHPGFRVDPSRMEALERRLRALRSLEEADAPPGEALATWSVQGVPLELYRDGDELWAELEGRAHRIDPHLLQVAVDPLGSLVDPTVLALEGPVVRLLLEEPGLTSELELTPEGWTLSRPPGVAIRPQEVARLVQLLSRLPGQPAQHEAALERSLEIELESGETHRIELGERRPSGVPSRVDGAPALLDARVDDWIRKAFSRP